MRFGPLALTLLLVRLAVPALASEDASSQQVMPITPQAEQRVEPIAPGGEQRVDALDANGSQKVTGGPTPPAGPFGRAAAAAGKVAVVTLGAVIAVGSTIAGVLFL